MDKMTFAPTIKVTQHHKIMVPEVAISGPSVAFRLPRVVYPPIDHYAPCYAATTVEQVFHQLRTPPADGFAAGAANMYVDLATAA